MITLIVLVLCVLFIVDLYVIVKSRRNSRKASGINVIILLLSLYIISNSIYGINHYRDNVDALKSMIETVNNQSENEVKLDEKKTYDSYLLLEFITDNILNNPELTLNVAISSEEELDNFISLFDVTNDCSKWAECYIKYTAYCLAEYSLNEDCDEYWHLKYIAHDKALSYNYGILIGNKYDGFIFKYTPTISFICYLLAMFLVVFWIVVDLLYMFTGGNKSDL